MNDFIKIGDMKHKHKDLECSHIIRKNKYIGYSISNGEIISKDFDFNGIKQKVGERITDEFIQELLNMGFNI